MGHLPGVLGAEYFREIRELLAGVGLRILRRWGSDAEVWVGSGETAGLEARSGEGMVEVKLVGFALARMSHSSR